MGGLGALVALLAAVASFVPSMDAIAISHWDLEGGNKTCDGKASCESVKRTRLLDEVDWSDRNCMCDEECSRYGDCCTDSDHFTVSQQRRGIISFQCVQLRQYDGIYMKTGCPPNWEDTRVREECETASEELKDPLAGVPATSLVTGITYRNVWCASCHNERKLELWHPRVECTTIPVKANLTDNEVTDLLEYSHQQGYWGIKYKGVVHACTVDPVKPDTVSHTLRRCMPDLVKVCAVNWTNSDVRSRCEAYTSVVYDGVTPYRNPHCAICNSIPLQNLLCHRFHSRNIFYKNFSPSAFSVLFDLRGGANVGKVQPCPDSELYDGFFRKCRHVINEVHEFRTDNNIVGDAHTLEYITQDNATDVKTCQKFLLDQSDYIAGNTSVYVPMYRKTFEQGDFIIRDDNTLEVCIGAFGVKLVDKFNVYMGYFTYAGLGISIIFLILHLVAFSVVSELRNLSGKNLASLCLALLVAYVAFMAGQLLEGISCFVDAIVTYYCFLASFFWMLTMSFDVWRTLRLATSELRVSAGKQWRKFTIYSVWSWLAPAVIVAAAVAVDTAPEEAVPHEWRPYFGYDYCWFGQKAPLWAFFAAPIACIMALDMAFFAMSAKMIYSTTSTTRFTASAGTQRDFKLYMRLATVMGLTWTVGLIAGALDNIVLWYVFIGLNTLQGLFIFLAFTCTDKVMQALAARRQDGKPLRPPSFSWSSADSHSHANKSQSTTDTLY